MVAKVGASAPLLITTVSRWRHRSTQKVITALAAWSVGSDFVLPTLETKGSGKRRLRGDLVARFGADRR